MIMMRIGAFHFKNRDRQRGQSTVEYVLVMVISVTVILGVLYQMNNAFRVFADNYFGEYLVCILETGEVPALGGTSTGECAQVHKDFETAWSESGNPPSGSGSGGSSNDDSSGSSGESEYNEGGAPRRGVGNSDRSAMMAAGKTSNRGGRAGKATRFRNKGKGGGGGSSESEMGVAAVSTNKQSGQATRIEVKDPETGLARARKTKKKERETSIPTKTAVSSADDSAQQRTVLLPIRRKTADEGVAPDIEEFSFGNILRYLIIAMIVIVIVVVIGGEFRQVQKSME